MYLIRKLTDSSPAIGRAFGGKTTPPCSMPSGRITKRSTGRQHRGRRERADEGVARQRLKAVDAKVPLVPSAVSRGGLLCAPAAACRALRAAMRGCSRCQQAGRRCDAETSPYSPTYTTMANLSIFFVNTGWNCAHHAATRIGREQQPQHGRDECAHSPCR